VNSQDRERGSLSVEMVIWAIPLVLILSVIIGAGRVGMANNAVDQIAHDVARIASIARTSAQAQSDATAAAAELLAAQDLDCTQLTVDVDTGGFTAPVGTAAQVNVSISCTVRLDDLLIPGVPGSSTLTGTASRIIDTYRERS
jgi:Flp pilus assembly protein TadG